MYGLIGKMTATGGTRDQLASILAAIGPMPGCLSYIVARDPADENGVWVTEVWESSQAHQDSLRLPAVQRAIAEGRPLIEGFEMRFETSPVGGVGLDPMNSAGSE